jgi:phage recombination protein Bet
METTALVTTNGNNGAMQRQGLAFTSEQRQLIRDSYANGATDTEFEVLMAVAIARNLNPLLRQIWFVQRWDSQKKRMVWATQTSIDGLRSIAQRTGLYNGQDEPEYERDDKGKIVCAKVKAYRKDWARPAVGVAYWTEYVQTTKDGNVTKMWAEKPHLMLAKCAEALALRKAFPEDTGGLYVDEEMGPIDVAATQPQTVVMDAEYSEQPTAAQEDARREMDSKVDDYRKAIAAAPTDIDLRRVGEALSKEAAAIKNAIRSDYAKRNSELKTVSRDPGEEG